MLAILGTKIYNAVKCSGKGDVMKRIDNLVVNTIRVLSAETVQKANSGHPGLPMGAAAIAYTLFKSNAF